MASTYRPTTPDDIVGKVLRRAEVAKAGFEETLPFIIDNGGLMIHSRWPGSYRIVSPWRATRPSTVKKVFVSMTLRPTWNGKCSERGQALVSVLRRPPHRPPPNTTSSQATSLPPHLLLLSPPMKFAVRGLRLRTRGTSTNQRLLIWDHSQTNAFAHGP